MKDFFRKFSHQTAEVVGSPWAFIVALVVLVIWALTGPVFHYSDTWQLVINTATTIITFLMVFLIQNTQNRDARALHLKIDELIRSMKGARNRMVDIEELSDDELERLQTQFKRISQNSTQISSDIEEVAEVIEESKGEDKEVSAQAGGEKPRI